MLHIAVIVGIAYAGMAILGYTAVLPILRAGREADRSKAADELEPPLGAQPIEVQAPAPAKPRSAAGVARVRHGRFARRARRPLAVRRPGV